MVNKKIIKDMARDFGVFAIGAGRGFLDAHLFLPTFYRKWTSSTTSSMTAYECGGILPAIGTNLLGVYPISLYIASFEIASHYQYGKQAVFVALYTQIGTNFASGIYELVRREYKKRTNTHSRTMAVPASSSSPLETKAQTPEIKPEAKSELTKPTATPKREIPNPWDVKIDPLENRVYSYSPEQEA